MMLYERKFFQQFGNHRRLMNKLSILSRHSIDFILLDLEHHRREI